MLYTFFRQILCCFLQLKGAFLTPPTFTTLSAIMSNQAAIFTHLVLRLDLSQGDYEAGGRLSLGLRKQPLGYVWTAAVWIGALTGYLTYLGYIPAISTLTGRTIGIADFAPFALANSIVLTLGEIFWWSQLGPLLGSASQNEALNLLYEYACATASKRLSKAQEGRLVRGFNRQNRLITRYSAFHLFTACFAYFPILLLVSLRLPNLAFLEKIVNFLIICNLALQGSYLVIFQLLVASQGFLLVRLFRLKLANTLACLRARTFRQFTVAYFGLDHQIRLYNTFMCNFIFMVDGSHKLVGTLVFLYFLNSGSLLTNPFALIISLFILISFFAINGVFGLFSIFSEESLNAYRKLHGIYVQIQARTTEKRSKVKRSGDLRQSLQMNGVLEFLGCRQFGFTYARQYVIEKKSVLENVLATGFYFILFLKRNV